MVSCSVLGCSVTYTNNPNNETFHRFPTNALLKHKWLQMLNRQNWEPTKNSVVCSRHFSEKCIIHRNQRRILLKGTIPTEFVPVHLQPKRSVSKYVYRDISAPSTSQINVMSPKIINKFINLQNRLKTKQQTIRNLVAYSKRLKIKLLEADAIINDLQNRLLLKENFNEISTTCRNDPLEYK